VGRSVEIRARTAHACVECEILFENFSLIFLSTPHLFLVKSMDTYLYINFIDTMGQRTHLSPPRPGTNWADWSDAMGREMYLRRALDRLNFEYPPDSAS
jgi:hypothetical protein